MNTVSALRLYGLVLAFFVCRIPAGAQLVINELMQSNVDCIMDDLNEFPDSWVELCNAGTGEVNLGDYRLGITQNADEAWPLPGRVLQPGEHVLVFCDKVGSNTDTGIHADFRLESGKGGALFLFRGGDVADGLTTLKKQPAPNIAYGRKTDGDDEWGYMAEPTPGAPNCGIVYTKVLDSPVFSVEGGVWHEGEEVKVKITVPSDAPAGTVVRFTRDGTEPTSSSPVFTGPIAVNSNTVVRAKLFCEGCLSRPSSVQSYIFFPNDRPLTLPVISLVTDPKYLYDEQIGIYVDGAYQSDKKNYEFNWQRPANFEFFEEMNQPSVLNQLTGMRSAGGASRQWQRKSLAIKAHKRFGQKHFNYEFFPDQRPGVTNYKSILLRNSGNDFNGLYLRDPIVQRTMASHADLDWQAWRPAIVYINGEYTGILNIRERSNADNVYTHYNGLEDIDMFEGLLTIKEGTMENYSKFKVFYSEEGHTMEEYSQWMDCEEFANLMMANIYFDNADFSGGNMVLWRPRAVGGRWRWIAKDMDYTLGYVYNADYNTLAWMYDNNFDRARAWANHPSYTMLFRRLTQDDDFRRLFSERFAVYMGDFLNERGVGAVMEPMYELIKTEFPYHRAAMGKRSNLESERERVYDWLSQRSDYMYNYIAEQYNLGAPLPLTVTVWNETLGDARILFNGTPLSRGYFDGKFFQDSEVNLLVETDDDVVWEAEIENDDGEVRTERVQSADYSFVMPECKSVRLKVALGNSQAITPVEARISETNDNGWYMLDGRRLREKPTNRGIYIHRGKKIGVN